MTPMKKWAQGMSLSTDRPSLAPGTVDLSRPDSQGVCAESALYSLDKPNEPAYLCLSADQDNNESVVHLFEKSVQLIGG